MKRLTALALCFSLIFMLCSCTKKPFSSINSDEKYQIITEIDHCVVEPDDKLHMSDEDENYYRKLMDAMLSYKDDVTLCDDTEKNEYYIDLLKQSPYFFFVKDYSISDNTVHFSYAFTKEEQNKKLSFIDSKFLYIVNSDASKEDNTLDKILNTYSAVARLMTYDHEQTENKQLDSPLFKYPADEIYNALLTEKSVCYGFAYTLRFSLLLLGIDCFCVYGPCRYHGEGHMWNIFKYNDKFYTCDAAWDRAEDEYVKLYHFGKTDKERKSDTLERIAFSSTFFDEYGKVECTDETFKIFRSITRYTYVRPHTYYMTTFDNNELIFDTETFELK